ncbi:unnamed protein product [Linum trigynum]|uniref:J domain-containing protein n=1 Tax=Linum trigynum TaxID=586398 RepID=A0AAV2DDU6_9ROSI
MPPRKSSAKQPRRKIPVKRGPRSKRSVKQVTHYEILSVEPDATYEEICAAYLSVTITDSATDDDDNKSLAVQKAFQVLSDTQWRAEYDEELRVARRRRNARVTEEVDLIDVGILMGVINRGRHVVELVHSCRCGGCFSIDSIDLAKMGYTMGEGCGEVWFESPEEEEDADADADADSSRTLGSVVIPCDRESCSLGVRFTIDTGMKLPWMCSIDY